MCENEKEIQGNDDTIEIPRKLLEQIYIDYQIFSEDYIINDGREFIKDDYWIIDHNSASDMIEKIDFYLKKEQ